MKKILFYFSTIILIVLLFNCSDNKHSDEPAAKKGRDIFGNYIPRGLTKTTEGLSPGYIMFSVPNSPYTYLVNRKGEVVHEWKGTYGAFNAIALHGPHQGAQKSTRTGLSDFNTSDSKLLSPTSRISFAIKLFPFCILLKLQQLAEI